MTCAMPASRMPTAILRRWGLRSLSMTIAKVAPDGLVRIAFCGMTSAFATVLAIISTLMLAPGRSVPPGVVGLHPDFDGGVRGVERGADHRHLAGDRRAAGPIRFASLPTLSSAASADVMWVRAMTCVTSITVTTGAPLGVISPG